MLLSDMMLFCFKWLLYHTGKQLGTSSDGQGEETSRLLMSILGRHADVGTREFCFCPV